MEVAVEEGELGEGEVDEKLLQREEEGVGEAVTDETGEEERSPRGSSAWSSRREGVGKEAGGVRGEKENGKQILAGPFSAIGTRRSRVGFVEGAWRPESVRRGRGKGVLGWSRSIVSIILLRTPSSCVGSLLLSLGFSDPPSSFPSNADELFRLLGWLLSN